MEPSQIDPAATAWLLVSTGLVLFMVVGLSLFYAGLVRRKNVLNTMMMSFVALGVSKAAKVASSRPNVAGGRA